MMGHPLAVILDDDELAAIRRRSFLLGATVGAIVGVVAVAVVVA